jgi:DNA-binding NtrC family response regulator
VTGEQINAGLGASVHVLAIGNDSSMRQMMSDYLSDNDIRATTLDTGREVAQVMERESG